MIYYCTLTEGGEWERLGDRDPDACAAWAWEHAGELIVFDMVLKRKGLPPIRVARLPAGGLPK